jgi:hypothetical protein
MSKRRRKKNRPQRLEKKKVLYCQCKLTKGPFRTTSWIPQKYAKKGKYVKLKREDATGIRKWDNGWLVVEVGSKMKEEEVMVRSQDYKHQRKASDK